MSFEWNADNFPVEVDVKVRERMEEVHKQLRMMMMHGYRWWIRRYKLLEIYDRDGNNDMWPPDKTAPHNMFWFDGSPVGCCGIDKNWMLWISGVGEIHRGTLEEFQKAVDTKRWDRWVDGWEIW